jgi:hypothetical protein
METTGVRVVAVSELRRMLTSGGAFQDGIAFQNDVNALLAAVARMEGPPPAGSPEAADGAVDDLPPGPGEVQAPFGLLPEPPAPGDPAVVERRRSPPALTVVSTLAISGHERRRRLLELR